MKRLLTFVVLFFAALTSQSQCMLINDDGSVTLSSNNFSQYPKIKIWRGPDISVIEEGESSSNYVGTLTQDNPSVTDYSVNANESAINYVHVAYYDLEEHSSATGSYTTLYLQMKSETPDKILLNWNNQGTGVSLYRKTSTDNDWKFITMINGNETEYEDDRISECYVQYKITSDWLQNSFGCGCSSNIAKTAKYDSIPPTTPQFTHIDVYAHENPPYVSFNWAGNENDDDIKEYIFGKTEGNGNDISFTTIAITEEPTYDCNNCSVKDENNYVVYAVDNCGNVSAPSTINNNIVLNVKKFDCNVKARLFWNACKGIENDIQGYYTISWKLNGEETPTTFNVDKQTTVYDFDLPETFDSVKFRICAYSSANPDFYVLSNEFTIDNTEEAHYIDLHVVSVNEGNMSITTGFTYGSLVEDSVSFELYRDKDNEGFVKLTDIDFNDTWMFYEDFLDEPADEHTYSYYISMIDCKGKHIHSDTVSAIKLNIDIPSEDKHKLYWNAYKGGWVQRYEVYSFIEGNYKNAELIGTTTSNSFTNNIGKYISPYDKLFYYVKAVSDNGVLWAASSSVYAQFESIFFVPNAFCPKKGNAPRISIFKPECHFVRVNSYSLKIYNRQGELLFKTNNTDEGWDGKYKGEFCPVGTYVYKIEFVDDQGMQQTKAGIFMLYD